MHVAKHNNQVKTGESVSEPAWVRCLLITIALGFLALFLLLPLAAVFVQALDKGWEAYLAALHEPDTLSAIWLTLLTATFCVPINLFRVTFPNIKWGILYGVILCNARAMGEFGAVSVVSGHVRGSTNTIPLQVEILYNEYSYAAAFAVASLLALLALVTLVIKTVAEWKIQQTLSVTESER